MEGGIEATTGDHPTATDPIASKPLAWTEIFIPNPDERCPFERQKFAYSDNEVTEYECFSLHSVSGKNH